MKKQDDLILTLQKHNDEKQSENERLSKAVIELKNLSDQTFEHNVTLGLGGIAIGIIVALLIRK